MRSASSTFGGPSVAVPDRFLSATDLRRDPASAAKGSARLPAQVLLLVLLPVSSMNTSRTGLSEG